MTSRLLVVGSVAFDTVETRAGKREEILGGAATYISLAASHFAPINLVGVVGENDFPAEHVELLTSRGVDVTGLARAPGRTFRWSGVYTDDFSSRTTLDTQLGVFAEFDPQIPPAYADNRYLMLGNIHPALQLKVLDTVSKDCFVAADTMNLWIDTTLDELKQVIARADLLVINDEESLMLTGEPQIAKAAPKIIEAGPRYLIIKRGEHGAFLFTADTTFFAPAVPLGDVIDPTGAGDSFAAGLMGLVAGSDVADAATIKRGMVYGAAIASFTCEGFGVERIATVSRDEIEARFAALRDLVSLD
ncbi:MAG: sugar kinase [Deltaproteobacteria bacterium]|nr:sugar kinase [Deltaproteobacteria bacterium]